MSENGESRSFRQRLYPWRIRFAWWRARRFGYRGQYLVGRDVPDVPECHATLRPDHSCPQHDGSHLHRWVPCVVTYKDGTHPQDAHRCTVCGGRKCDVPACTERRHHVGPHHEATGYRLVGADVSGRKEAQS